MDKLTEQNYTGYYDSENGFSITGVSNNAVIAEDFNKLIDEVNENYHRKTSDKHI